MDRQTLRDWVHCFNAEGPEGLIDRKARGKVPKLNAEQKAEAILLRKFHAGTAATSRDPPEPLMPLFRVQQDREIARKPAPR